MLPLNTPPPVSTCLIAAAALLAQAVFLRIPESAFTQEYLDSSRLKVQRHVKRKSSTTFPRALTDDASWGVLLWSSEAQSSPEPVELIAFEQLPDCRQPVVQRQEVSDPNPRNRSLDVLFYSDRDLQQAARAKTHPGLAVAYRPALVRQANSAHPEYWQQFARFIGIDCLPSRYRFIASGSRHFIERRLGTAAWENHD